MKKRMFLLTSILMLGCFSAQTYAAENVTMQIDNDVANVDGTDVSLNTAPVIVNGSTLVPLRFVSENLGYNVDWNDQTKTVSLSQTQQTTNNAVTDEAAEKIAIREVFDKFSVLADQHKIDEQTRLFADDGVWRIYMGDNAAGEYKGYDEIFATSDRTMKNYVESSHFNGQQVITLVDDTHATAIGYSHVTLDNGEAVSTSDVRYEDEYVKINGQWKIAVRNAHFITWSN